MCGIAGIFSRKVEWSNDQLKNLLNGMGNRLAHRGPDNSGIWISADGSAGLSHRRLSIIDPSPDGNQPMISSNGRYVIIYNGECYNFPELRESLSKEGVGFNGNSDTEVVLEACSRWGVEKTLKGMNGIFAFALWDIERRTLVLARDHVGVKPLYWGWLGNDFVFSSELKALKVHPNWRNDLNHAAVSSFIRYNFVAAPQSIFNQVLKLAPGSFLRLTSEFEVSVEKYWSLEERAKKSVATRLPISDEDAIEELDRLLGASIRGQMISDVPLGAFLSSGVDSSAVVSIMQANSMSKVKTFCASFDDELYSEGNNAKLIADHLGTDHLDLHCTGNDALDVIPKMSDVYDEPFADPSQIPTFLLSKFVRDHVTVALSGDGGDELFSGYGRYFLAGSQWRLLNRLPLGLRRSLARTLLGVSAQSYENLFSLLPQRIRKNLTGNRIHRAARVLDISDFGQIYDSVMSHWDTNEILCHQEDGHRFFVDGKLAEAIPSMTEQMQLLDTLFYLPDNCLTKLDRASMFHSLEARVPLLDHRLMEFSWRLPLSVRYRNGVGKWVLRQVLAKYVPPELFDRPKMGFNAPIGNWMRGPLRDWCEVLLSKDKLEEDGIFRSAPIRKRWEEHLSGRANHQYSLWVILMFQDWRAKMLKDSYAQ